MFAQDAVEVRCPFGTVASRLRSPWWLRPIWEATIRELASGAARASEERADAYTAELGHRIQIGQPRTHAASLLLPVFWEARGDGSLAIALDGDLEATPLDDARTRLGLSATYSPPAHMDKAGCHALATAAVSGALAGVAASLDGGVIL